MTNALAVTDMSPTNLLKTLPGWENLERKDQIYVEKETLALGTTLAEYGQSRLAIGEKLTNIQDKLPKGMFSKYLQAYHFKRSTAYKSIKSYRNSVQHMPEFVLREAMRRNMPILGESDDRPLGVYTDYAKKLPPPASDDKAAINQYLDTLEAAKKRADGRSRRKAEIEADADVLLKQSYRFVSSRLNKLPNRGRTRRAWVDQLVGMLLTKMGVSGGQTFEPEAVPDEFVAQVGRPRKDEEEAA